MFKSQIARPLLGIALVVLGAGLPHSARSVAAQPAPQTVIVEATLQVKVLEDKARVAEAAGRYKEAGAYFEACSFIKEIKTHDDAHTLIRAAENYALGGAHEKAISLWQRLLLIPTAPGARRPSLMGPPFDLSGSAYWGIAVSLQGQGRWAAALAQYKVATEKYPLDEGCVFDGSSVQYTAMAVGACLENLGRHGEAVNLYLTAAAIVKPMNPPLALRRLVDLYSASGQLSLLDAAIKRERGLLEKNMRANWSGDGSGNLDAQSSLIVARELANSGLVLYEMVRHSREAARRENWLLLLAPLKDSPGLPGDENGNHRAWQRREAISALALKESVTVPLLQNQVRRDPENPYIAAALAFCGATERERQLFAREWPRDSVMKETRNAVVGSSPAVQSIPPVTGVRLPSALQIVKWMP